MFIRFRLAVLYFTILAENFKRNMDRLFGRSKAKQPPPNLTDCISNVRFWLFIVKLMKYIVVNLMLSDCHNELVNFLKALL